MKKGPRGAPFVWLVACCRYLPATVRVGCFSGRASVTAGEVQVSQWAGLASSPSAFSTDTLMM